MCLYRAYLKIIVRATLTEQNEHRTNSTNLHLFMYYSYYDVGLLGSTGADSESVVF